MSAAAGAGGDDTCGGIPRSKFGSGHVHTETALEQGVSSPLLLL